MKSKTAALPDIYDAAVKIILRRPHSQKELSDKLHRKGYFADEIQDVLQELLAEGHLDDQKLAKELVRWHMDYRPMGRRGLFWRLLKKGFQQEAIEVALEPLSPEKEKELAAQLARQRAQKPAQNREKVGRFLLARGFSQESALSALEQLSQTQGE